MLTIQLLAILCAAALVAIVWALVIVLSWALIHGAKLIERRNR